MAMWLSKRPPTERRPEGFPRATTLAALVNGGWLLLVSVAVVGGSIDRLVRGGRHVRGVPVLVVSAVASVVMVAGAVILGGEVDGLDEEEEEGDALSMRAVLLDTAADAASAAGVAVAGGVIAATGGLFWLDPAVALVVSRPTPVRLTLLS